MELRPDLRSFLTSMFHQFRRSGVNYVILRHFENFPESYPKREMGLVIDFADLTKCVAIADRVASLHDCHVMTRIGLSTSRMIFTLPQGLRFRFDIRHMLVISVVSQGKQHKIRHRLGPGVTQEICRNGVRFKILRDDLHAMALTFQYARKPDQENLLVEARKVLERCQTERTQRSLPELQKLLEGDTDPISHEAGLKALVKKSRNRAEFARCAILAPMFFLRNRLVCSKVIYLSGPDGSGKTTAVNLLATHFSSHKMPFKKVYVRGMILRKIGKLLSYPVYRILGGRRVSFRKFVSLGWDHHHRGHSIPFKIYKRLVLIGVLCDNILCAPIILFYRLRYQNVIVEISPFDYFVKYHMPRSPLLENLSRFLVPAPNRWIIVTASATTIHARRAELSIDEIDSYYATIERITKKNPRVLTVGVENSSDIDDYKNRLIDGTLSWNPREFSCLPAEVDGKPIKDAKLKTHFCSPNRSFCYTKKDVVKASFCGRKIFIKTFRFNLFAYALRMISGRGSKHKREISAGHFLDFVQTPRVLFKDATFAGTDVIFSIGFEAAYNAVKPTKFFKINGEIDRGLLFQYVEQCKGALLEYRARGYIDCDFISDNTLVGENGELWKIDNELLRANSKAPSEAEFRKMHSRFVASCVKHIADDVELRKSVEAVLALR